MNSNLKTWVGKLFDIQLFIETMTVFCVLGDS